MIYELVIIACPDELEAQLREKEQEIEALRSNHF